MRIQRFERPHAGGGAHTLGESGQRTPGLRPPLLRHRRPPKDPIEELFRRAQQNDPEAWLNIRTLIERREEGDRFVDRLHQWGIAVFCVPGWWLYSDTTNAGNVFIGAIVLLLGQPFWIWAAARARQPVNLVMAIFFAVIFIRSIYTNWGTW